MFVILLTIVFVCIAYRELRFIRAEQRNKGKWLFLCVWMTIYLYNAAVIVFQGLPDPNQWLKAMFAPLQAWML